MIKWSFQKLTNAKKNRIKINYYSCFILIPATHLISFYGNHKSKKLGRLLEVCKKLWEQLPCKQLVMLQMMTKEKPTFHRVRSNRMWAVQGSGQITGIFTHCLQNVLSVHFLYMRWTKSCLVHCRMYSTMAKGKWIIAALLEPCKQENWFPLLSIQCM